MSAKYYIYRNLQKPGFFSIKHKGIVETHCDYIVCNKASLHVSLAGNARARVAQQRNVHAFVVADTYCAPKHSMLYSHHTDCKKREITYNPFRHTQFVYKDTEQPVESPIDVLLLHGKLYQI